jgi:2-C-methyl-D-erythritol 2,4-cyclodiphosphate synthase
MRDFHYEVGNIDCMVLLQKPKLAPYIPEMRKVIANLLNITVDQISIKATTTEGLGFVGREEGCAAYSTVLLIKRES